MVEVPPTGNSRWPRRSCHPAPSRDSEFGAGATYLALQTARILRVVHLVTVRLRSMLTPLHRLVATLNAAKASTSLLGVRLPVWASFLASRRTFTSRLARKPSHLDRIQLFVDQVDQQGQPT